MDERNLDPVPQTRPGARILLRQVGFLQDGCCLPGYKNYWSPSGAPVWGVFAIFSGRLSDSIGHRKVLIPAVLMFSVLSSPTQMGFVMSGLGFGGFVGQFAVPGLSDLFGRRVMGFIG